MAGGHPAPLRPVVVAMKGHPGSGKSTAARAIATALCCPLLDKDDVRDCMLPLEGLAAAGMLNDLSYAVLWRMAERQDGKGFNKCATNCPTTKISMHCCFFCSDRCFYATIWFIFTCFL
ncbi:hypothetical protein ZEAMMB73_Zm00001d018831 [Zea mays]|uniref:Uncharacterized protein n=1 Tax=Zea mays TaxID=4577 RepID=A0A1D6HSM8_MAIZE|nr:hypothetical protein ZEAMMB73_Zm00001d018831 [Zea mays]